MADRIQLTAHLRNRLEQLSKIDTSKELARPDLGDANFAQGIPAMNMTLAVFSDLHSMDLDVLPLDFITLANQRADATLNMIQQIRSFSLNQSHPTGTRNRLLEQLESECYEHISKLGPHLNYLLVKKPDFDTLDVYVHDKIQEVDEFTATARMKLERTSEQSEAVLLSVQADAAKAGVARQSTVFENQARKNRITARCWLGAVVTIALLSGITIWSLLYSWAPSAATTGEVVREVGGRFAALTLLAFILGFTIRQYAASKHNETVNVHRQNALQTFELFVSAADDQETKDAVLLEATRAIFAPQSSGFLRNGREPDSPSTMVEVIRRIGSTPSS